MFDKLAESLIVILNHIESTEMKNFSTQITEQKGSRENDRQLSLRVLRSSVVRFRLAGIPIIGIIRVEAGG